MSTSMPSHSPLLLVAEKPDTPSVRPHCTKPLDRIQRGAGNRRLGRAGQGKSAAANEKNRFILLTLQNARAAT